MFRPGRRSVLTLPNLIICTFFGVGGGIYIFKPLFEQFAEEQRIKAAAEETNKGFYTNLYATENCCCRMAD